MLDQNLKFEQWANHAQSHIEHVLEQSIPSQEMVPNKLHEAMRYAVLGGGKRIRALLAYATGELFNVPKATIDIPASAVELIHAFSLVHDDMPCMDDDDLRRGKPSTHKQFDDATALLAGDALQSLAFELIASTKLTLNADQKNQLIHTLAYATGSRGMAGGQSIDLESTGIPLNQTQLEQMHQLKTGALIHASIMMGALCANHPEQHKLEAIEAYSSAIGLAFQVVDDILDAEADTETLGKTAGKDAENNKSTYVTILGLNTAKKFADELHKTAITSLSNYHQEADALRGIANLILKRNF